MLAHEAHGHRHHRLHAVFAHLPDHVVRVRLEPLHRPHPALVRQHVLVLHAHRAQLLDDEFHAPLHLLLVRVTRRLDVRDGNAVRGEEHDWFFTRFEPARRVVQLVLDELRHALHVPRPLIPGRDHHVLQLGAEVLVVLEHLFQQTQRRAARGDGELRVQREDDEFRDAVLFDLRHRVLRERLPIPHAHVHFGAVLAFSRHGFANRRRLLICDAPQRRTAPDGLVRLSGLGRAVRAEQRREGLLQETQERREADDVGVREQVVKERLHVLQTFGAAQVQQKNPDALILRAPVGPLVSARPPVCRMVTHRVAGRGDGLHMEGRAAAGRARAARGGVRGRAPRGGERASTSARRRRRGRGAAEARGRVGGGRARGAHARAARRERRRRDGAIGCTGARARRPGARRRGHSGSLRSTKRRANPAKSPPRRRWIECAPLYGRFMVAAPIARAVGRVRRGRRARGTIATIEARVEVAASTRRRAARSYRA